MSQNTAFRSQFDFCLKRPLVEGVGLLLVTLIVTGCSWMLRSDRLSWQADPTIYEMEL